MKTLHSLVTGLWPASSTLGGRLAFALLFLGAGFVLGQPCAAASFQFEQTGNLTTTRSQHTATLLANGKVLAVGGDDDMTAELYDPASGTWADTGSLATARSDHTATLLPDGRVLVVGGHNTTIAHLASAELYDPISRTWTTTGSLAAPRHSQTATLLPNGKVLVAGGAGTFRNTARAELYDPVSGTWTETGKLATGRAFHTATLLPDGNVLVTGGDGPNFEPTARAELYDPARGTWSATPNLADARTIHTATLLPNGKVLVAAGVGVGQDDPVLSSAELYDVGLGFSSFWQPEIATVNSILRSGHRLRLTGSRFQGISQASGGNTQDSSSNYPIVQLRSLDNSQVVFLLADPVGGWSDTSFISLPLSDFPFGPALVTVFTNGIPSTAKYLVVKRDP
jgi:hypothetical protein